MTEIQGGGAYVDLADGRIITLAASPLEAIYGRCCSVGYLILYGRRASGDWYATLRHSEGSCYALNEPAVDEGASIHFSFGLRLLKAPSFDPGVVDDGQFNAIRHQFCINDRGQVVAYE